MIEKIFEHYKDIIWHVNRDYKQMIRRDEGDYGAIDYVWSQDEDLYFHVYFFKKAEIVSIFEWSKNHGLDWKNLTLEDFMVMAFEVEINA